MSKMNIAYSALEDIHGYERNARNHPESQIKQIIKSITEFGFNNPILIDERGEIIAGHGRYIATKEMGLNTVPTITLSHLNERQKRAYRLADNKIAENGGWNLELLQMEIKRYLQTKECDKELLNRQIGIIPSDDEKDILEMSHWLDYKTTTQKQLVIKIENILQKPSFKFSTLKNMADFCRNYAVLCTYIHKTLNNSNSKNLLTKIEQYINSHDDTYRFDFPEYGIVLYSQTPDKNSEFQANAKFVNNAFETLVLKKLLKDAREEKDFPHILIQLLSIPEYENAISREVYLFVLFSDTTRQKELFDMKHSQSSYKQYLQMVKLLLAHKNNALHCVQRLCAITQKTDNIQKAFYERLIEDINSLKTSPDAGLSEVYTVKNILHE